MLEAVRERMAIKAPWVFVDEMGFLTAVFGFVGLVLVVRFRVWPSGLKFRASSFTVFVDT